MAVDSRDKRMSLINLNLGVGRVLVNPNGAIDTGAERAQYVLCYSGLFLEDSESSEFHAAWAMNRNTVVGFRI